MKKKVSKNSYDVDKDGHIGWNELDIKEKIAYALSVALVVSGILMAFICLFTKDDITDGALFYIGEAFVTAGSLLGVGMYMKTKIGEIDQYIHQRLDKGDER